LGLGNAGDGVLPRCPQAIGRDHCQKPGSFWRGSYPNHYGYSHPSSCDTEVRRSQNSNEDCRGEVVPSVGRNFDRCHPYTWEANHRHAYFLQMLAKDADKKSRNEYLWTAEELLREVVIQRRRVLGDSSPKSVHSFVLLRDILLMQGRSQDAEDLWAWCEHKLSCLEKANFASP